MKTLAARPYYIPRFALLLGKIIERDREASCIENKCSFGTMLRIFGLNVYGLAARVSRGGGRRGEEGWYGWSTLGHIVVLHGRGEYMLDVGVGNSGFVVLETSAASSVHVQPAEARLVFYIFPI